jgi:hypothetical protein
MTIHATTTLIPAETDTALSSPSSASPTSTAFTGAHGASGKMARVIA